MPQILSVFAAGNLGNNVGAGSDGVLTGVLTPIAPAKALLKSQAVAGLCITDDGGLYVDESTPFSESTGDDVEVLPATPADDDAVYFGHATLQFARVDVNITTQGAGTWTITYEYWNGTAWTALTNVTDGTTGFTAASGWKSITFDLPTDWATTLVDNVLGYWIRGVVSDYSAVTTAPQVGQGWIVGSTATWTDDTTDFASAGAGDVNLLPTYPVVGDAFYIGHTEKFCVAKVTTSTARTGTATFVVKYWDGAAWAALATVADDSVGWSATAGTHLIHFVPPTNWAQNTALNGPNGQTGFFISVEMTAMTSVTAQPKATRGWVLPIATGALGLVCPTGGTISQVSMSAKTISGTTADSVFVLINATKGTAAPFTWTKAVAADTETISLVVSPNDQIVLAQIKEDGSTEFADAQFWLCV